MRAGLLEEDTGRVASTHSTYGLNGLASLLVLLFALSALLLSSCGKKGPPTLRAFKSIPTPVLQRALNRENSIFVFWSFPAAGEMNIAGFGILRASDGDFRMIAETDSTARSFRDREITSGNRYEYMVVTMTSDGIPGADSNIITVRPAQTPNPPEDVSFAIESDAVVLSWLRTGSGPLYNIYRKFKGEEYGLSPVNDEPLSGGSFRDGLFLDRTVFYTVRSLRDNGVWNEGPPSGEITVNASESVPSAPEGLSYFTTPDRVFLFWTGTDDTSIRGYRIYRRMKEAEYRLIAETRIPSFIDTDSPGVARDFRITTLGPAKESPAAGISVEFAKD